MSVTDCPELAALEGDATAAIRQHLAACTSCSMVVELIAERRRGVEARDSRDECAKFEMMLAARDEGTLGGAAGELLETHLRVCADCQAVAATMPPVSVRREHSSLPSVHTGAYALGREVARGGMGRIFAAEDLRIGRPVAVKELLGKGQALAARFEREARVTARLQHPGIVPIYEIGKWPDGTPFYAMRMVEGRTLREAIRGKQTLDERLALLPAMIAAAEAVAFAHGKKIIHRDLTPSNILVGDHGDTVVIDWGLAKDLTDPGEDQPATPYRDEGAAAANLTSVGAVIGTAAYMPPEQARGESVDERADVYALGAVAYHLLAGEPPYRATKSEQVLQQVLQAPPPPIGDVAVGAPRDLVSLVDKAMARDITQRYANAGELAADLRRFQTGRVVEAHHYSRGERARRWIGAHRVGAGVLAAVAIAGTIGLAGVLRERDRAETGERDAIAQRTAAETANALLLEESGRQELLAGHSARAAVWLSAAYSAGDTRTSLRFLLARAMHDVEALEREETCDGPIGRLHPSPDHSLIASTCTHTLVLWNLDGTRRATLAAPGETFENITWSNDGTHIASISAPNRVLVWNIATRSLEHSIATNGQQLLNVKFSPDDASVVTAGLDRDVQIWDVRTGELRVSLPAGSSTRAGTRAFFLTAQVVMTISLTGTLTTWDVTTGKPIHTMEAGAQLIGGNDASDERAVFCGVDGVVRYWNPSKGVLVREFRGHIGMLPVCRLSPDGTRMLTTGNDGTAKIWDVATGAVVTQFAVEGMPWSGEWFADGKRVVTAGLGTGVHVWDAESGVRLGGTDAASVEPDGLAVIGDRIYGADGPTLKIWRGLGDSNVRTFRAPGDMVNPGDWASGRTTIADKQGVVTIWDVEHDRAVAHVPLHDPAARGDKTVVARTDGGVAVVDVRDGKTLRVIDAPGVPRDYSDDDHVLVLEDGDARSAWDVQTGKQLARFPRGAKVSLSPLGNRAALVGGEPSTELAIWDVWPARELARIRIGRITAHPIGFDHDGARLAVKLGDSLFGEVVIYDASTGRVVTRIPNAGEAEIDASERFLTVKGADRSEVRRLADGSVLEIIPSAWTDAVSPNADASLVAVAHGLTDRLELLDAHDDRVLVSLPIRRLAAVGVNNLQIGVGVARFMPDGTLAWNAARDAMSLAIVQERRSPEAVAAIVKTRVHCKLDGTRLVQRDDAVLATVHGTVTRHGKPVAGASVGITIRDVAPTRRIALTDGAGHYELAQVPLLPASIDATSEDASAFTRPQPIELHGAHDRMDLELDLEATIAGRLLDASGAPTAGATVHAYCKEMDDGGDAITAKDGTFTIPALSGGCSYALTAKALDVDALAVPVKDGQTHVTGIELRSR